MKIRSLLFALCLGLPFFGMAQIQEIDTDLKLYEWAENKGQWHDELLFRTQKNALDLQIARNYIAYYFYNPDQVRMRHTGSENAPKPAQDSLFDIYALRFQFAGTKGGSPFMEHVKPHYLNFFQGQDPSHWAEGVRVSNEVGIQNLYPGINLKVLSKKNQLKYEFWLEPNANINQIQIEVSGASSINTEYGDLFIETPLGTIREQKPYAYQFINGREVQVPVQFQIINHTISFKAGEAYQPQYPLVIDPEIVFLTYSGSTVDNFGCSATPGENGTLYAAGVSTGPSATIPNGKYPVTAGAFQVNYRGGGISEGEILGQVFPCDITFSKYSADGTTLLYATYVGGSNNEVPHSLYVDDSANLIIMGNTYSNDYPVSIKAYDKTHNGRHDLIITKFRANGSFVASTYLGGTGNDAINYNNGRTNYFFADSYRGDVITDSTGNIIVASVSQSTNFPTTPGCIQNTLKGSQDGLVIKMNPDLSQLLYSTYLGGDSIDVFYSVDLGENHEIYLSGGTCSDNFPKTAGHFQPSFAGGQTDGIIAILDYTGKNLLHATYFGTSSYDQIFSLDIDKDNYVYVVGQSTGNIPVSPGVYNVPNSHQFLACFNPDLGSKRWSTVFGSGRPAVDVTINAFLVDECNRIYVSSWGGHTSNHGSSSTNGLQVTPDAFQTATDGNDFYLMLLNKNASSLLYATFLGGDDPFNTGDHVDGGTSRFDKKGVVYQSMCASCPTNNTTISDLKTTPNAFAPVNVSPRCSNAALKFDFRVKNAAFSWEADTCASIFKFHNKTQNASNFFWRFPTGDTSYDENPVLMIPSTYYGDTIMLIAEFGTNCADTAYGSVSLPDSSEKLLVPNVFTPNNDGKNDFFRIEGVTNQCSETEVYIYNRWGQLYFEDHVAHFRWDGKDSNGIDAPEGVYYFMLKTTKLNTSETQELHGTITLIR